LLNPTATTDAAQKVIVSQAEMMRYHDPERIQSYCLSCEKYGLFWSCPPFEEQPLSQLPEWTHALLVTQKTRIAAGSSKDELISQFLSAREILGETMKRWEVAGTVAVIAGHCSGCTACTRPKDMPCSAPERMRYSLEALGFDVSGLAEGLAGQTMHWPSSGVPDYLITVGALLCPRRELAEQLMHAA
jgi:predicted metal-binding protein